MPAMATIQIDPQQLKANLNNISIYGDAPEPEFIESIRAHGVLEPLTADRDSKVIISGHRRRQAAIMAGLETVPVTLIEMPDPDEQLERLIESNRHRDKTAEQRAREYKALLDVKARLAKARQKASGGDGGQKRAAKAKKRQKPGEKPVGGNSRNRNHTAKDQAAADVGMSAKTADQAAAVVDAIDEAEASGDQARADDLRDTLNQKSVAAASRKAKATSTSGKEMTPAELKTDTQSIATYLIKMLGTAEAEFKRLVVEKDGNENKQHKTAHLQQNAQEFLSKLRNAKAVLQANKPHIQCTFCGGTGRAERPAPEPDECEKCLSSGWLTKRQHEIYGEAG